MLVYVQVPSHIDIKGGYICQGLMIALKVVVLDKGLDRFFLGRAYVIGADSQIVLWDFVTKDRCFSQRI